ncbi:MAG TPA: TetR/AcrR family transcriptional regulator [Acidimicrobiales bacterium]|nr:TetR/AcrR family transcriptional regulator [Acidimicrobiales bacterium]
MTPATLVAALRTREIARRAGVSPPTFFHHFRTIDDYARALVAHVFSPTRTSLEGVVTEGLREVQRLRLPAEQSIAYHRRDLHMAAADPDFRLRTGLWALGGPAVDGPFSEGLRELDRQLIPQAEALHRLWGREVRPPLDMRSHLAVQLALLQGSVMRHLAEGDVMTPERYARAAAALSMVMLRPTGDRRTLDDRLSEMNYYPGSRAVLGSQSERRSTTRARLLDAAAELFAEYGYEAASISAVARTAGVHVATLYEHFESKAHVGLTLFDAHASAQLAALGAADAAGALRQHLEEVADFVATHSDLARLYLTVVACGDQPAGFDDGLRSATLRLVTALPDERLEGRDPGRTTDELLVCTIGAMLRHPGDGAAGAAASALRLLPREVSGRPGSRPSSRRR